MCGPIAAKQFCQIQVEKIKVDLPRQCRGHPLVAVHVEHHVVARPFDRGLLLRAEPPPRDVEELVRVAAGDLRRPVGAPRVHDYDLGRPSQ